MPAALGPGDGTGQAAAGGDGGLPQEGFAPERSRGGWRAGPRSRSRHPDEDSSRRDSCAGATGAAWGRRRRGLNRLFLMFDEGLDELGDLGLLMARQLARALENLP